MENFEKCTVAMLGGPCSQHVTGNTSRQNQPQSAIIESIDYHEAARKASFLGIMCEYSLMAAIHFERRFDALMKYVINSQEHPIGKVKESNLKLEVVAITW